MAYHSSIRTILVFLCVFALYPVRWVSSSASSSSMSRREPHLFVYALLSQCPRSISPNSPLKVNGYFIERSLASYRSGYTSILFYASWCPFSLSMLPKFGRLSSMFPEVEHFMLEQSSALPSVFSKYGIYSLPSILLVNQSSKVKYHGRKDLFSLVQFYEKNTGCESVELLAEEQQMSMGSNEKFHVQTLISLELKEIWRKEPYVVLSSLFLCLRVLISLFPEILSRLNAWASHVPRLRLEILGERSQTMGRILYLIDVRRIWAKLRLCKTRNFHGGTRSARVWASMASVSLGESSAKSSSF